jgi:hypothetical protein
MTTWQQLAQDTTRSPQFDDLHARLDNYQIYSLAWCDQLITGTETAHQIAVSLPAEEQQQVYQYYGVTPYETNHPAIITSGMVSEISNEARSCIAFQSFDPAGIIPFDFAELVSAFPSYSPRSISYYYSPFSRPNFGGPTRYLSIDHAIGRRRADYRSLITGNALDSRSIPLVQGTATSTRRIKFGCYQKNTLETHPSLLASLDWQIGTVEVLAGESYMLRVIPVLGTLVVDNQTRAELIASTTAPNTYPLKYLFSDQLSDLFTEWDALYPMPAPTPPPPEPLASTLVIDEAVEFIADARTYVTLGQTTRVRDLQPEPIVRVMAANNDYWGYGSSTQPKNRPPNDHGLFSFDHQQLFETLQPDGSYGIYMTDSPRILEIHAALEAGTYATYIDENGQQLPRVANLGWLIEKMSNILGLRRKPSGKYLDKVDQAKYDRTRLNSPKWAQGDYDLNSWGNKGYALRHLPTSYEKGQRQDNQYDLVHDLPQLLAAVLDQIDLGQGLQHTAEIRMKVGKEVQSYPNVGQLTIDLAARVIELEALVEKMVVMQVETSNSVRELFPGIGIPVATKSVSIDIGGKQQQIFYPGFQAGKGSILDSLSAIKMNLGIALGQLMPQKKPDSRWNPFDRKPK